MERDGFFCAFSENSVNFNSHAHVERDEKGLRKWHQLIISTHTLTWSVTSGLTDGELKNGNFNSHAHVERDLKFAFTPMEL